MDRVQALTSGTEEEYENGIIKFGHGRLPVKNKAPHARDLWKDLTRDLPAISSKLLDLCKSVEPDFLRTGLQLQNIHGKAVQLTRQSVDALKGEQGEIKSNILNDIVANAQTSLSVLEETHEEMGASLARISEILILLDKLKGKALVLNRISRMLKMVGLNISVESARYEEARESFHSLAVEIKELAETVNEVFGDLKDDSAQASHFLSSSIHEIDRNLQQLKMLSLSANEDLQTVAPQAKHVYDMNMQAIDRTVGQAEQIARWVSDIVVGIQIHDNIAQRAEHIVKSLLETESQAPDEGDVICAAGEDDRMGAAFVVINLQKAQLQNVIEEIMNVQQRACDRFHKIGAAVDEIIVGLQAGIQNQADTRNGKDPVKELQTVLVSLHGILGQGAARVATLHSAVKKSSEVSARMRDHLVRIRDINFDIHLKALNAIAQSLRLGAKGRSIGVLVHEIKELADKSDNFVAEVEEVIAGVNSIIEGLTAHFLSETRCKDDGRERLDVSIATFSKAFEDYAVNARKIAGSGQALKADIDGVIKQLAFLDQFSDNLSRQNLKLVQWEKRLLPWADSKRVFTRLNEEQISKRYTMEQERIIHQSALGAASSEQILKQTLSDNDDIDLCDGRPASGSSAGFESPADQSQPSVESAGDGIEWFDDWSQSKSDGQDPAAQDPVQESAAPAENEADLGDNVELF